MKLAYYKQENWAKRWIDAAHKTILDVYEEFYAPSQGEPAMEEDNDDDDEDDLFAHLYKRHRVEKENELERYLEAGLAEGNIDLLSWWKVRKFPILHL